MAQLSSLTSPPLTTSCSIPLSLSSTHPHHHPNHSYTSFVGLVEIRSGTRLTIRLDSKAARPETRRIVDKTVKSIDNSPRHDLLLSYSPSLHSRSHLLPGVSALGFVDAYASPARTSLFDLSVSRHAYAILALFVDSCVNKKLKGTSDR